MTRVGWVADPSPVVGGAELTQAELRAAAPEGVEVVDCPPGQVDRDCDVYALHNCMDYSHHELQVIRQQPAVKYWNDVGPWLSDEIRSLLVRHARPVVCSPLQADYMGLPNAARVPPPIDLDRFETAALAANGTRAGSCCIASWRNFGKGARQVATWAQEHDPGIDFYGSGPFRPPDAREVAYPDMPALLAGYRRFVFLPTVLEPFGRLVVEAWAAGCDLTINSLVGARYWIEHHPEALRTAAADYWRVVLA